MAQKTEKEETEFKVVPETLTLCINNCGVTGNPATNNMCQKCFEATTSAPSTSSPSPSPTSTTNTTTSSKIPRKSPRSSLSRSPARDPAPKSGVGKPLFTDREKRPEMDVETAKKEVNRCSGCRRKVGLTGFRCRCGELFCSDHRYSDRHDCSYDYKAAGREAIARENPVVKAAKIVRV